MKCTLLILGVLALALSASFASQDSQILVTEWDVPYLEKPARITLDVHYLKDADGIRPALVVIHGGGWTNLDKDYLTWLSKDAAKRGYVVFNINYRLAGVAKYPAAVEDCQAAMRSSRATCVVDFYGVTDLTPAELPKEKYREAETFVAICEYFLGKKHSEAPELFAEASPLTHVTKDACPFIAIHGDADPIVPYEQSFQLVEKLRAAGVEATLHTVKDGKHGPSFGNAPGKDAAYEAMWSFLAKHLKP
jgi:acetyl esterase/lipase